MTSPTFESVLPDWARFIRIMTTRWADKGGRALVFKALLAFFWATGFCWAAFRTGRLDRRFGWRLEYCWTNIFVATSFFFLSWTTSTVGTTSRTYDGGWGDRRQGSTGRHGRPGTNISVETFSVVRDWTEVTTTRGIAAIWTYGDRGGGRLGSNDRLIRHARLISGDSKHVHNHPYERGDRRHGRSHWLISIRHVRLISGDSKHVHQHLVQSSGITWAKNFQFNIEKEDKGRGSKYQKDVHLKTPMIMTTSRIFEYIIYN